jgi:hypothetical protein
MQIKGDSANAAERHAQLRGPGMTDENDKERSIDFTKLAATPLQLGSAMRSIVESFRLHDTMARQLDGNADFKITESFVAVGAVTSKLEGLTIDTDRLGAAARLMKQFEGFQLLPVPVVKLPDFRLPTCLAAEMQRLQESLAVFRSDTRIEMLCRSFDEQTAFYREHFGALSGAIQQATAMLRPSGEMLLRLAEEKRIAEFILELGFVPHGELWGYISDVEVPVDSDLAEFSSRLVAEIWPELRSRLALSVEDCFGDAKLYATFQQMIDAHDEGLHEMTLLALPSAIERAVDKARQHSEKGRTFDWIRVEVAKLPVGAVGGIRGYRVWKILLDHTFADCWSDAEADAVPYPNRHASAHGKGSQIATAIHSLNAILLTHFVITVAKAVYDYRDQEAA